MHTNVCPHKGICCCTREEDEEDHILRDSENYLGERILKRTVFLPKLDCLALKRERG